MKGGSGVEIFPQLLSGGEAVILGDGSALWWIRTDGSGPTDIFVLSFPGPGGKWRLATDGGKVPAWSRATHELLYWGPTTALWS